MLAKHNEHWTRVLAELKNGSTLTKQKRTGEKFQRQFFLDAHEQFISYQQSEKFFAEAHRYYIAEIDEIRVGFHTLIFDGLLKQQFVNAEAEKLAFSIFYNNYRDELHLMAKDAETRHRWVTGLQYLINNHAARQQRHVIRDNNWILSHLRFADKDRSSTMDRHECRKLLAESLNVELTEDEFEQLFNAANTNADGHLTPDEFIQFFHSLTQRRDLFELMQKYVANGSKQPIETIRMSVDELLSFLKNVQKQHIVVFGSEQSNENFTVQPVTTREQVQRLIDEFESSVELRQRGFLSLEGFRNLLLSDDFSIMKSWCHLRPYQDMTRPLSDYYINASHNTYLFDTQVCGDSNPEAYNRALRAGCRVLEIDCYDGDNGQPIVTHGHTFVRPCPFESIIRLIKPNLFKTSPYPVILSIENHCSAKQQKEMTRILKEVLGNQLVTQPPISRISWLLPSPEDLKYKVLIRSGMHSTNTGLNENSPDLFVYLRNSPFREYEYTKDHYVCTQSSSLAEKQFERAARADPTGLIKQTQKCLLRMYPDGLRQDSSNPDPVMAWNFGVQMVALNYQNDDYSMQLCYGKFLDNGACGYVLKPSYLIQTDKSKFNPWNYSSAGTKGLLERPLRLKITIISGQFLDRANDDSDDIPDPYVVVSTQGIQCDKNEQKTNFIENNGLNPIWNETFQFDINFPQMCLVRFDVYDYDIYSHDEHLAYYCLPVTTMETGYRHVHLRAKDHDLTYSSLFVHVAIENQ